MKQFLIGMLFGGLSYFQFIFLKVLFENWSYSRKEK